VTSPWSARSGAAVQNTTQIGILRKNAGTILVDLNLVRKGDYGLRVGHVAGRRGKKWVAKSASIGVTPRNPS